MMQKLNSAMEELKRASCDVMQETQKPHHTTTSDTDSPLITSPEVLEAELEKIASGRDPDSLLKAGEAREWARMARLSQNRRRDDHDEMQNPQRWAR